MPNQHAEPPPDRDAEELPSAAFGSTEKSLSHAELAQAAEAKDAPETVSPIDAAFAACRAVGGGNGAFGSAWISRLLEVVRPAYGLLYLTHDQPAELVRLAYRAKVRFTAATEKNLALLCVKIAARPQDTDQDKVCSEWSALLRCALAKNISPDDFVGWTGTTTVAACKKAVAEQQRAAKITADVALQKPRVVPPAAMEYQNGGAEGSPRLELRVFGADGTAGEMIELPASIHAAVLDAMTSPASQIERLERLLASLQVLVSELSEGEAAPVFEASEAPVTMVTTEVTNA